MGEMERLIEDTESILEDILLSGFQNIHSEILKEIAALEKKYEAHGMYHGKLLLHQLGEQLRARKNSIRYDIKALADSYSQVAFYLACL